MIIMLRAQGLIQDFDGEAETGESCKVLARVPEASAYNT
jgi:hypothetical protein